MTPLEAADAIERDNREHPGSVELTGRVRVLIDHARATSPAPVTGERLLALADKLQNVIPGGGGWLNVAEVREELRRLAASAPAPVEPLKAGDTVTTAAELDRLSVGTVVRDGFGSVAVRVDGGWYEAGNERLIRDHEFEPAPPARVLDLGGAP